MLSHVFNLNIPQVPAIFYATIETMKVLPDFSFEKPLWENGHTVIGIDEVGRGAFAGPVAVGGVVIKSLSPEEESEILKLGINDSKKLSPKKREELSRIIKKLAEAYYISFIPVETINEIGIGKSTFLAMREVVNNLKLKTKNPFLLIDGFEIPDVLIPQKGIVRGDSLSVSIASASIIAKVARDSLMTQLSETVTEYGFEKHKGYGTVFHREAIRQFGLSIHHRKDFCQNYV